MSIKANVLRDSQGNITIQMQGGLTYEHTQMIRDKLTQLTEENPFAQIQLDLGGIDFVGSSGICHFVETLKIINEKNKYHKIALSNVRSEFKKVFRLYQLSEDDFLMESFEMNSDETLNMSRQYANRKKTFEN